VFNVPKDQTLKNQPLTIFHLSITFLHFLKNKLSKFASRFSNFHLTLVFVLQIQKKKNISSGLPKKIPTFCLVLTFSPHLITTHFPKSSIWILLHKALNFIEKSIKISKPQFPFSI
jgi:hypothetical protein